MKKLIWICFCFFSFCVSFAKASASSWRFEWTDTIVHIPVGAPLEEYKAIPKAMLYRDNILQADAEITYLREGDWLYYLSGVNTSVIGEYEVWYKAYENNKYRPGTCPGYKCKVKFIVEDTIAPVVEVLQEYVRIRRGETFSPLDNVRAKDNYFSDIKLSYTGNLDMSKPGIYTISVYAEDGANNRSELQYEVEVYENQFPTIHFKGSGNRLSVALGAQIDLSEYFTAFDEIDGDLSAYIQYPYVDTSKAGISRYALSVTNFAGLETVQEFEICVVDDSIPVIQLIQESVVLDYKSDFTTIDFTQYVKSVVDNAPIDSENLRITHNLEHKVGTYFVRYGYADSYTALAVLKVELVSFEPPVIEAEEIRIQAGESVSLADYITVIDASDANIAVSLEIYDDSVDYTKAGIYYAEAYAINSSGLSKTKRFKVIVEEAKDNTLKSSHSFVNYTSLLLFLLIMTGIVFFLLWYRNQRKKNKNI